MTNSMKATLEKTIEKWFDAVIESEECPSVLYPDDIVERMAEAASLIFDQSVSTAKYIEENGN